MQVEIIVPLIVFGSIVLVMATPFYFRHRNQRILYEAIKTSIEKTGNADEKLIDAITHNRIGPNADLRRGVLLIAVAIAIAALHLFAGDDIPYLGVALFPGLIGLAYLAFHRFFPREMTV